MVVCSDANKALACRASCFDAVADAIKVHHRDSACVARAIHVAGVFGIDGIRLVDIACLSLSCQRDAVNCV
jgi:hypothetical protein